MERDLRVVRKTAEKLPEEVHIKTAHLGPRPFDLAKQPGAPGKVDDDPAERLIQGNITVAIAGNSALVSDRLFKGHTQRNPHILNRVVVIDVHVTLGLDLKVNQAMPGNLIQHVVKKGNTRFQHRAASAIQIDGDPDLGF